MRAAMWGMVVEKIDSVLWGEQTARGMDQYEKLMEIPP